MSTEVNCNFCANKAIRYHLPEFINVNYYECPNCVDYIICGTDEVEYISNLKNEERLKISSNLREMKLSGIDKIVIVSKSEIKIDNKTTHHLMRDLITNFPNDVEGKVNRSIINLYRISKQLGNKIILGNHLIPALFALNTKQMLEYLDYMEKQELIKRSEDSKNQYIELTVEGWRYAEDIINETEVELKREKIGFRPSK